MCPSLFNVALRAAFFDGQEESVVPNVIRTNECPAQTTDCSTAVSGPTGYGLASSPADRALVTARPPRCARAVGL